MRSYSTMTDDVGSKIVEQVTQRLDVLNQRMEKVTHKIAVVSGKGGVGKSTVAAAIAASLAKKGHKVGVMIPKALGVENYKLTRNDGGVEPPVGLFGIKVMSLNFFVDSPVSTVNWKGPSETNTWIGAMEANVVRELLADTEWGKLDYLIIDTPPSIDRLNDLKGLLPGLGGAVIVTIPSDISYRITIKTIEKINRIGVPILGLVENMKGYECAHCGGHNDLFEAGGMNRAVEYLAPYLGGIPFNPHMMSSMEEEAEKGKSLAVVEAVDKIRVKIEKVFNS